MSELGASSARNPDPKASVDSTTHPPKDAKSDTVKGDGASTKTEPLAPPPRPDPNNSNALDYFSGAHATTHLATEQNPFESSFANGGSFPGNGDSTPGGTRLPSVASLTSPAAGFNFWNSLRTGPLSPAMLSGPQGSQKDDYFSDGHHLRNGGFPTPNESSLRTGLTPGGGGSMFPMESPNPSSLFPSLNSAGQTPAALDFERTAQRAPNITSQPQEQPNNLEVKPPQGQFDQSDANTAANSLFLLANNRNNPAPALSHYTTTNTITPLIHRSGAIESSPNMSHHHHGSVSTNSGRALSEQSDDIEQQHRPNTRGKGKRNSAQMSQSNGNGRRVKEEPQVKAPASKKIKGNSGIPMEPEPQSDQEELDMSKDEYNASGKKMTDEEKRKNFLERNRVAALKCRQRKKQWLANLQSKCEMYSQENDHLNNTVVNLQEELNHLKQLLLAHKNCSVGQEQSMMAAYNQQPGVHPYGVGIVNAGAPPNHIGSASQPAGHLVNGAHSDINGQVMNGARRGSQFS